MTPTQQYTKETGLDAIRLPHQSISPYTVEYIEWLEMKLRGEQIDIDTMFRNGRRQTMKGAFGMRSFIYCKQKRDAGYSLQDIALILKVSPTAVSYKIKRYNTLIERDKFFQKVVDNYNEALFLKELKKFNNVRYPKTRK